MKKRATVCDMSADQPRTHAVLSMGPLANSFAVQLRRQGLRLPLKRCKFYDQISSSINLLLVQDILTDSQVHRARERLAKRIFKEAAGE